MHALTAILMHVLGHNAAGERTGLQLTLCEWPAQPVTGSAGASENLRASWETVGEARRARRAN